MPTQLIIFGASGDLTSRKLVPALTGAWSAGDVDKGLQIIGVSRREKTDEAWREELREAMEPALLDAFDALAPQIFWAQADGTVGDDVAELRVQLDALTERLDAEPADCGRLFYMALAPSLFGPTVHALSGGGMLTTDGEGWRRVVVEKPFGTDLASAQALNAELRHYLREDQIFRIDHYLGKETVQNILGFRFQNAIFEPLWSRDHIESVEISVCEAVGMEGSRGHYYDTAGALRDMVQNHVLQVLALVAMEPPASMSPRAIRDEKVKVLEALRPFTPERAARDSVRAQYGASEHRAKGYLQEEGVAADSSTESFVALRGELHTWRWSGVPFLIRTGKCLHKRYTEVILRFRQPPVDLLGGPTDGASCALRPNGLRLLIQPSEGIRLAFLVKQPGSGTTMRPASLGFDYADLGDFPTAPAYQRLLVDALNGNPTLFIRDDEVEAAWRFVDSIKRSWAEGDAPMLTYPAGSEGPAEADALFRGCEGVWGDGERDI